MVLKLRRISSTQLQALNRAGISVILVNDTPKPKLKLIQGVNNDKRK